MRMRGIAALHADMAARSI